MALTRCCLPSTRYTERRRIETARATSLAYPLAPESRHHPSLLHCHSRRHAYRHNHSPLVWQLRWLAKELRSPLEPAFSTTYDIVNLKSRYNRS